MSREIGETMKRTSTIDWENEQEKKVSIMTRVDGDRLKRI